MARAPIRSTAGSVVPTRGTMVGRLQANQGSDAAGRELQLADSQQCNQKNNHVLQVLPQARHSLHVLYVLDLRRHTSDLPIGGSWKSLQENYADNL